MIRLVILYMTCDLSNDKFEDIGNFNIKVEFIIQVDGKMIQKTEKDYYIIAKEIFYMTVFLRLINLKGLVNNFRKK